MRGVKAVDLAKLAVDLDRQIPPKARMDVSQLLRTAFTNLRAFQLERSHQSSMLDRLRAETAALNQVFAASEFSASPC